MLILANLLTALRVNLPPFFFVSHGHIKERLIIHVLVEGKGGWILFCTLHGQKQLNCTTRRPRLWRLRFASLDRQVEMSAPRCPPATPFFQDAVIIWLVRIISNCDTNCGNEIRYHYLQSSPKISLLILSCRQVNYAVFS